MQPMQLGFVVHDPGLRDMIERLPHHAQSVLGLADVETCLRQKVKPMRRFELGTSRAICREACAQLSQAFVAPPQLDESPAVEDHRLRRG